MTGEDSTRRAHRSPLRPLARVIRARDKGENPDLVERENIRQRHEVMRDRSRHQSEGRLLVLSLCFVSAFAVVGVRMAGLATSVPEEPRTSSLGAHITSARANIVDRNGAILATNLVTQALYAHPQEMVDIPHAIRELVQIFPDLDENWLKGQLSGDRKFVWIRKTLSPEQMQQVHDIGDPGLLFASRDMRLYPNAELAAHVLGGASFGDEGVRAAEVIGVAGIEKAYDERLRDPAQLDDPLQLSIDLTVQATTREVLAGGVRLFNAKGGSAIIMDVGTGEVISMVSLPDFDPNDRPPVLTKGDQGDSPLFNRAVQGVYELGSVYKVLNMAQALDLGLVTPQTMVDTKGPMIWGRFKINDFHDYGPRLTASDVIKESSNIGSAHIALMIGANRQREFLQTLGFLQPTPVELFEAPSSRPILPAKWGELASMTISYGHGLSTSPLHLAAGYASIINGGTLVRPTLIKQHGKYIGQRVVSEKTSAEIRDMMRLVVQEGTASFAKVPGYDIGGKTGSADKPRPSGGYYKDKVIATFASAFPMTDPRYVIVLTLDEASETAGNVPRRTAGWTAVPVTGELIRRVAPLLGVRPEIELASGSGIREARN